MQIDGMRMAKIFLNFVTSFMDDPLAVQIKYKMEIIMISTWTTAEEFYPSYKACDAFLSLVDFGAKEWVGPEGKEEARGVGIFLKKN